ncbi:MAG: LamG domain-containing protein [Verrucomicrobia bacterium]|nr:LamG domain-containing protein [Verrucomicrobiota bacterium]
MKRDQGNDGAVGPATLPIVAVGLLGLTLFCTSANVAQAEAFAAYYTRVNSGEAFERVSRTGPDADIVVRDVGASKGRVVFWRGSSYLPYWEVNGKRYYFEELTERSGNGPEQRPDKINMFSVVRIIESGPQRTLIHWRYLPKFEGMNPHWNATNIRLPKHAASLGGNVPEHLVDPRAFVDEYFAIEADGSVVRTFRRGTQKRDDWLDSDQMLTQHLTLTDAGIERVETTSPQRSLQAVKVAGNPALKPVVQNAVRYWNFDEGVGNAVQEAVMQTAQPIRGHKSYWKKGVSGNALAFDGYTTAIQQPTSEAPQFSEAFSAETWIALAAYPWNDAPIVDQAGQYALSITDRGHLRLKLPGQLELLSGKTLPLRAWVHVAASYDAKQGADIYVNGETWAEQQGAFGALKKVSSPLRIGQGDMLIPTRVSRVSHPALYSIDGLLDELRLYDRAITETEVKASFLNVQSVPKPDLDQRKLPDVKTTGKFGARYTNLGFYDTWDGLFRFGEHPDVVVEFDDLPTAFVFWRGVSYLPMMVNEEDQWLTNEFNETWNRSGGWGCMEPMSDKESFCNHVKILENTPARVRVLWRYPLIDVFHTVANYDDATGWGDWSDWVYTIYPDGFAVKNMRCWNDGSSAHEWHESIFLTQGHQRPEDVVSQDDTISLISLAGEKRSTSWRADRENLLLQDAKIHQVNLTADYDAITIGDFTSFRLWSYSAPPAYSVYPTWEHWPAAQIASDCRWTTTPGRLRSSSLTTLTVPVERKVDGPRPYERATLMEGMSNKTPTELAALAKSWLRAPEARAIQGCEVKPYVQHRREYSIVAQADEFTFSIEANNDQPIQNLCFVVQNWGYRGAANISVDRKPYPGVRQGTALGNDGALYLVVWIKIETTEAIEICVQGAQVK